MPPQSLDELRAIAARLRAEIPPVGASDVCAIHDGGYRVAWLVNGRTRQPFGPLFSRPRDVGRLVDLLRGAQHR